MTAPTEPGDIVYRLRDLLKGLGTDWISGQEFIRHISGSQIVVDSVRAAADEITTLREACQQALGSLKALGAEEGGASQTLRRALGLEEDHD